MSLLIDATEGSADWDTPTISQVFVIRHAQTLSFITDGIDIIRDHPSGSLEWRELLARRLCNEHVAPHAIGVKTELVKAAYHAIQRHDIVV